MQTNPGPYLWDGFAESCPEATIVYMPSIVDVKTGAMVPVNIKDEKERWDAR